MQIGRREYGIPARPTAACGTALLVFLTMPNDPMGITIRIDRRAPLSILSISACSSSMNERPEVGRQLPCIVKGSVMERMQSWVNSTESHSVTLHSVHPSPRRPHTVNLISTAAGALESDA
jgi:hypothetical protein